MKTISESTMQFFLERLRKDFDKGDMKAKEEIFDKCKELNDLPDWFIVEIWDALIEAKEEAEESTKSFTRERIEQGM